MEIETILGFIALACFVLTLFIVLVARIASARRNRAKRKEKAEELTRIYVNTAIQRLKISGLERRNEWLNSYDPIKEAERKEWLFVPIVASKRNNFYRNDVFVYAIN